MIGPQFRRRCLGQNRFGDPVDSRLGIAIAAHPVDEELGDVLDDGETTGRVAVQSGVAGGQLALVPGGEDDPSPGVGHRHQQHTPDPGLEVLIGQSDRWGRQDRRQHVGQRLMGRFDGDGQQLDTEVLGQKAGITQ